MFVGRCRRERQQAYQEQPSYQRDTIHGIPPDVLPRVCARLASLLTDIPQMTRTGMNANTLPGHACCDQGPANCPSVLKRAFCSLLSVA